MNKLLFTVSRPPYAGSAVMEQIEAALVAAVFDLEVSLLFRDDGVWALQRDQDGTLLGHRSVHKALSGLGAYDIQKIYVCEAALATRGIDRSDLCIAARTLSLSEQQTLIASQDAVIGAQT